MTATPTRCLCVDEKGNVVTGDHILYIYGRYMKERGKLITNTVVTTVMSNFGLYKALDELGIDYAKTAVGDKYVYEYMQQHGSRIGGEQSGHIIFSKYASTGDGILTSLKMMEVMMARKKPMSELAAPMKVYPQVLENVKVTDKAAAQRTPTCRPPWPKWPKPSAIPAASWCANPAPSRWCASWSKRRSTTSARSMWTKSSTSSAKKAGAAKPARLPIQLIQKKGPVPSGTGPFAVGSFVASVLAPSRCARRSVRSFWCCSAARDKALEQRVRARLGRLLNSGWNCTPMWKSRSGSSTASTRRPSGLVPRSQGPFPPSRRGSRC